MKHILTILLCLWMSMTFSQSSEEDQVKATIEEFFEAFHKQDTTALKAFATDDMVMQSIGKNREGKVQLKQSDYSSFVKSIGSIPQEKSFEEKLLGFNIQVDGPMANAWTPYEFWFDGKFSHCGVNSFQLIKQDDAWKILYLIDTRRRESCDQ